MRNMMHDDMARWYVQGKIKWGALMSHEMISTLTYTLIEFASFIFGQFRDDANDA